MGRCVIPRPIPHVVHVSTATSPGLRRGVAEETSLTHTVGYEAELKYAIAARTRAEELSREPDVLNTLIRQAEKEHGRAGPRAVGGGGRGIPPRLGTAAIG